MNPKDFDKAGTDLIVGHLRDVVQKSFGKKAAKSALIVSTRGLFHVNIKRPRSYTIAVFDLKRKDLPFLVKILKDVEKR